MPVMHLKRRASTAIVLYGDTRTEHLPGGYRDWRLRLDAEDARQRAKLTPAVCSLVAMAYEEGMRLAAERMLGPVVGDVMVRTKTLDEVRPTYPEIRNFLAHEIEADPVVACRVAMARTVAANLFDSLVRREVGRDGKWWL
jgi:hypothetical protein